MPKRDSCSCEKCRECCGREPGWFLPEEIPAAASYLNISERDFMEKFIEMHETGATTILSPATKTGSAECIFLDERGFCKIHPARPYECRKVFGCEPASRHRRIREIIARRWK